MPRQAGAPATIGDVLGRHERREAAIDRALHLIGIAAAVVGGVVLLSAAASARNAALAVGVALYLSGLFAMLICSALYNQARPSPRKALLRRFDHAAIFLLIAGTYSPFMAGATDDLAIAAVYFGVWSVAALGIVVKLLFPGRFGIVSTVLYLALGWSVVLVIGPLAERVPPALIWLLGLGGVLYSIGVVFYVWERLPYQNALWHGFVLSAAATHYAAVLAYVSA
jgi:hemolysin III